eukprot:jgi/Chrzof1/3052/Cz12g09220.t1
MPAIRVKSAAKEAVRAHPREFALLTQLGSADGAIDQQVLEKAAPAYGDATSVNNLISEATSGPVDFEKFAAAFKRPSQSSGVEGEGNALGWAARDKSAVLAPLKFPRRELGDHDVFIKITHAGMCHSDLHTINGDWGDALYPIVPGHEIVGVITEVGPSVTKFKVGDRAGVGVFVDSCRECKFCKGKDEMYCAKTVFTYNAKHFDGLQAQGGYSTHIVMDEQYTFTIPDSLPLDRAAPLLCAGITTYSPYKDYGLDKPGLKIGVNGLGGLGHMAVKFGVAFGCEVYVLSRSKAKEKEALAMGAKAVIPTSDAEAMKAAAATLNGIIDTVSAPHDLNALLELLEPRGKLVMVGLPPGKVELDHFPIVTRHLEYGGSNIGNLTRTQEMLDFCGKNNIACDVEVIDMEYVHEAFKRMEKGDVKFRFVIDVQKSLIL